MAATLSWAPTNTDRRTVFNLTGATTGGRLSFGDGTWRPITPDAPVVHTYPADGSYNAAVTNTAGARVAAAQVHVRPAVPAEFAPSTEPGEEFTVTAVFGGDTAARVKIDFGDGTPAQELWATPGGSVSKLVSTAGAYTGTARDLDARRISTDDYTVTGPVTDPDFTLTEKPGQDPRTTAVLEFTKITTASGEVTIDWGHPGGVETVPAPKIGTKIEHTFTPDDSPSGDGVFFVMVYYTSAPDTPTTKTVTVPFSG